MGRLKKYLTKKDKIEAKRKAAREFYWNNKEREDAKSRQRYKNRNLQNNKS